MVIVCIAKSVYSMVSLDLCPLNVSELVWVCWWDGSCDLPFPRTTYSIFGELFMLDSGVL